MSEFLDRFAAAFYALDKNDIEPMSALLAEDVVMVTPQGTLQGKEAVVQKFRSASDAFSDVTHEVDLVNGVIDNEDALAVEFMFSGVHTGTIQPDASLGIKRKVPATGRRFRVRTTDHVWRNGEGLINRFHIYLDPTERMRQLGITH